MARMLHIRNTLHKHKYLEITISTESSEQVALHGYCTIYKMFTVE